MREIVVRKLVTFLAVFRGFMGFPIEDELVVIFRYPTSLPNTD